ncbi:hypothetical protein [Myxococcus xanthus]|uniref:Uncharacterized protein n=1 Tax=Myxococcus xanthus TaxID=34 RepID=A0AAE6G597_MYXXA|nr:hypothetical protein [Myxococcus xanthus]QDE71067.1 hypothetical protein BHS09_31100 [Myxococcus xanthus]QDE78347.1 hypothetical protein BHS08_31120 [Myxococcus xanthus]QDE99890.1 hypothetical protein BHS05_30930 [Myxococcus xanthus]
MSDGKRRPGRPGRSEEPRIAPDEDEDATRDIPLLTRPEETRMGPVEPRFEETRMGPVEPLTEETRMGPVESFSQVEDLPPLEPLALEMRMGPVPDARAARAGRSRGVARSARTEPPAPPAEVHTDVMPPKPPRPRGGPEAKATGGVVGAPEKRASPPKASASPASVGVVRLSPLEPLGAKVVAAEEAPALRTMFANHSALLAEQLRDALSTKMYGRGPHRVLRIDEPEGPSTAGGKLARQAISLVPRKGAGSSLTCGWVDVSKREAQLRNFEAVAKRYELHHGEPLEMQAEEYERFLSDVEAVLTQAVIKVRVIVPEEAGTVRVAGPAASARATGVPPLWAGLLAVLAFVLGLLAGRMGWGG